MNLPLEAKLRAAGYPPLPNGHVMSALYGAMPSTEARLAELRKRRDAAQRELNLVLRAEPSA
jgi:hypothetical protein